MRALLYDSSLGQPGQRVARLGDWWARYLRTLKEKGIQWRDGSPQLIELAQSVQDTVALLPDPNRWGETPSPFKGLIVGSVQSGKTTNMIGLTAAAIDQGYRIIIALAGRTEDLRQQTSLRFNQDLMSRSDEIPGSGGRTTLPRPPGPGVQGGFSLPYAMDAADYSPLLPSMNQALRRGEPCVLVVKKWPKSLSHVGSKVLAPLYEQIGTDALPMLVLDDECDDGSVPGRGDPKDIPELITRLWRRAGHDPPHVAYVGYTATAAASLLQDPELELYPSHFAQLLRYPSHADSSLTYKVANADDRYTGSFAFYEQFGGVPAIEDNFLVCPLVGDEEVDHPPVESDSLVEAVIAYFVSGAFRLALNPPARFDDPEHLPPLHTMIVQASSSQIDHKRFAYAIRDRFLGEEDEHGVVRFDWERVGPMFAKDERRWRAWYSSFEATRTRIDREAPHRPNVPNAPVAWADVRGRLADVVNNVKLRVVNSDVAIGTSLSFTPPIGPDGRPQSPQDVFTIAVGGGILSRGLTIEGLCISYYTRDVDRPLEDATMQMSRWFGYRGKHLEFCRLFTTMSGYERLRAFHENDQQHRARLALLMENRERVDRARIALRTLPTALLTAKIGIGKTHDIAFSPYTHVFSTVDLEDSVGVNETLALSLVHQIELRDGREIRVGRGHARGMISSGWSATEVADVLDAWSLSTHNPDPADYPHAEYHRQFDPKRRVIRRNDPRNDPYLVAAYLRWWAANPGDGPPPSFNVGVTYGPLRDRTTPFSFALLNRTITTDGRLDGGWGGEDKTIDGPAPELIDGAGDRKKGAEGLLLLHIVHAEARGRNHKGHPRDNHTISFGIAVPAGGRPFAVVVNYDRR
jgi:Z1 domain